MKYAVALLIAAVKADAPPAYNEPPFAVATHPAATGLIQLNANSACATSGISGIVCGPSDEELFADGMKGDADLELKIQMKGNQFDTYNQKLLMIESSEEPVENNLFAVGNAGDEKFEDPSLKIQMKGNQFDTYLQELVQFADGEKGDAEMGLKIQMKGDHFDTYKQDLIQIPDAHNQRLLAIEMSEEPAVAVVEDEAPTKKAAKVAVLAPEKVFSTDPKIAKSHTTFYNRQ